MSEAAGGDDSSEAGRAGSHGHGLHLGAELADVEAALDEAYAQETGKPPPSRARR